MASRPAWVVPEMTQVYLRSLISYDAASGYALWRGGRRGVTAGQRVGTLDKRGYVDVTIDSTHYQLHRLIWLYVHGAWPEEIDHVNGNPSDNRLCNIRECRRGLNHANRRTRRDNGTGLKGAFFDKRRATKEKPYFSSICKDYKSIHLGTFRTAEEAHAAYCKAAKELFGEFARSS